MAGKVLIVEDEIINAMALSEVIPGWGCTVVDMVTSGEDAIRVSGVNSEHSPFYREGFTL
jgi:CheY-like chemotaxis protein